MIPVQRIAVVGGILAILPPAEAVQIVVDIVDALLLLRRRRLIAGAAGGARAGRCQLQAQRLVGPNLQPLHLEFHHLSARQRFVLIQ